MLNIVCAFFMFLFYASFRHDIGIYMVGLSIVFFLGGPALDRITAKNGISKLANFAGALSALTAQVFTFHVYMQARYTIFDAAFSSLLIYVLISSYRKYFPR
jgi:hypothetical protein